MTDLKMLHERIKDSGMTIVAISQKAGMVRETLYNRLNGKGEFTASEIVSLSDVLHLTRAERDKIFLSTNVN